MLWQIKRNISWWLQSYDHRLRGTFLSQHYVSNLQVSNLILLMRDRILKVPSCPMMWVSSATELLYSQLAIYRPVLYSDRSRYTVQFGFHSDWSVYRERTAITRAYFWRIRRFLAYFGLWRIFKLRIRPKSCVKKATFESFLRQFLI